MATIMKHGPELLNSLGQHITLTLAAVGMGIIIAVPLAILLTRHKKLAPVVLALASTIQTIPGLVMLGLALVISGVGVKPALFVLTIYSILPVLQNTYTGINEVLPAYKDAAKGLGMTKSQVLMKVELPLALPAMASGVRISAVYIVSWATLAGMVGAGGLGDWIWTGLSTYNTTYILFGAVPSALLAVLLSTGFGALESALTPRGMRRTS